MQKITEVSGTAGKGKTIAVDFDGVIHGYSKGWQKGVLYDEPVEGTKEAMESLKSMGFRIIIFSTRNNPLYRKSGEADQMQAIIEYLEKYEIPFDKIHTGGKPMAEIYIDDRAIGFRGDWNKTIREVKTFKVWNK